MSRRFEANRYRFEQHNPRGAALLSLGEPGPISGDLDEGASQLALKAKESSVDVLYVYGIGLGKAYEVLVDWLHEDPARSLIFLEDDLAVIAHFLDTPQATALYADPQVHLYFIEPSSDDTREPAIDAAVWGTYPRKAAVITLPAYQRHRPKACDQVTRAVYLATSNIQETLEEYRLYGIPFYRSFWKNIPEIPGTHKGWKLRFPGVPAIIVGAGPSLAKQLPLLHELRDKALFFAGGSALNALMAAGIRPHFGGGIDPNPEQYLRLRQGLGFGVPFFYQSRMLTEALDLVSGPRLYLRGGGGYNTPEWLEQQLHIHGRELNGGVGIANLLLEQAYTMGCRPIILVGMDLSYSDKQLYAPGVSGSGVPTAWAEELSHGHTIPWKDYQGRPTHTEWKWIVEAKWISAFASCHPRLRLLNATEGGIAIENVSNMPLRQATESFTRQKGLDSSVQKAIKAAGCISGNSSTAARIFERLRESLCRSIDHLAALMKEMARSAPREATLALLREQLEKEEAWGPIFLVFHRMRTKLETLQEAFVAHPKRSKRMLAALARERTHAHYAFLRELAVTNVLLIDRAKEWLQAHPVRGCQLLGDLPYKDGLLHGVVRLAYPDGTLQREIHMRRGKRHGMDTMWEHDGSVRFSLEYANGVCVATKVADATQRAMSE